VPTERTHHHDTVTDEFAWLADKDNPDTVAYLAAENAWTERATAHLAGLRETLFEETRRRTRETDLSVPSRKGGYWYYTRTAEGRQYGIHCRRAVRPGETDPPATGDGGPLVGEDVLLDGNKLAEGNEFFALPGRRTARCCSTSPWTRPGGRTRCGGTPSGSRRPRTPWSSPSPTSVSGWASS
jgi:oligopeptidase B